jgi:hypothetical protein
MKKITFEQLYFKFSQNFNSVKETNWKTFVCKIGSVKIYKVDGDYVRSNTFVDFTEGGHFYVYKFIPENEIWIDILPKMVDMVCNLAHELYERYIMKYDKLNYNDAHDKALSLEYRLRHKYDR